MIYLFIKQYLLSLFHCGGFPAQPFNHFCISPSHTCTSPSPTDSGEFIQVCAGSSHFPFLAIRNTTEDLPQVLGRFCLVLPHITLARWVRVDLSSSHSTVPKCLSHAEQTHEQGTLPSLLPIYFPSHSELITRDTDTFASCAEVRSIVSHTSPLGTQAGDEARKQETKEKHGSLFGFWLSFCLS